MRLAAHDAELDGLDVHRHVEGLAHADVLERVLALDVGLQQLVAGLVEAEEHRAQLRRLQHLEVGAGRQALHVLRRHGVDHVHVAREQGGHAGGGVANHVELDLVEVAGHLVPPARVGVHGGAAVGLADVENEGAGAVLVPGGEVLVLLGKVHRLLGMVILGPLLGHDPPGRDLLEEDRVRHAGGEIDGVVVYLGDAGHRLHVAVELAAGCDHAPVAEHHVVGG